MPYPELDTERMELLAVIHPDLHGPGEYYTEWINMATRHKLLAILLVGDINQNGTVAMEIWQAQDSAGTGAVYLNAITTLTQAGGDGDNAVAMNLRTEQMDSQNKFTHVRFRLVFGGAAAANAALLVLGNVPRYAGVSQTAWTEVIA